MTLLRRTIAQWASIDAVSFILYTVGVLGLVLRALVVDVSNGANDLQIWWMHTDVLRLHGFAWAYAHTGPPSPHHLYNHPPLPGLYALWCRRMSHESEHTFAVLFKLPCLAAEMLSAAVVAAAWKRRRGSRAAGLAFAAYGVSLVSIAIAAFHCNTDAIPAAFALLSCELSDRKRDASAGLALAAAVSVKLIPILIAPVLFARAQGVRGRVRLVSCAALAAVPYLPLARSYRAILASTFGYVPQVDHWGLSFLANLLVSVVMVSEPAATAAQWFAIHGRQLVYAASILAGILAAKRRGSAFGPASMTMLGLVAFSPGFGVQYMIAASPLLVAFDIELGLEYGLIAGAFVACVYFSFLRPIEPYQSTFTSQFPPAASAIGLLAWGSCVLMFFGILRRELRR